VDETEPLARRWTSLHGAFGPQGTDRKAYGNSHGNFKESVDCDGPSAVRPHEHYECQRDAGCSIRVALQPERREESSYEKGTGAESESVRGKVDARPSSTAAPTAVPAKY
jgi:hypothetical protein